MAKRCPLASADEQARLLCPERRVVQGISRRGYSRKGDLAAVDDAVGVSLEEQIACIEREIGFRVRGYPRWVRQGKLTQVAADEELRRMRGVLATLQVVRDRQLQG